MDIHRLAYIVVIFVVFRGKIIRVDSVVRFFRLRNVLNYVLSKGYLDEPDYQRWRAGGTP